MPEPKKLPIITVHSRDTDRRVILWERDPAHPSGEIFLVANGKSYRVAETKEIKRLIAEEVLVKGEAEVEAAAATPPPPGRRKGRTAPELRPATETEEKAARPPLTGDVERQTARVPDLS